MHINVSRLHNAYVLRRSRTCTDTVAVLRKLPCASPLLFASTSPRAMQDLPFAPVCPRQLGCPRVPAFFFFFPHRPIPADSSSETHGGGVRCQTSCSLPPSRAAGRSLWKNYSDICMCHSYKAPGTYPPARQPTRPPHEASPFQPAACLRCPSSLHLRQSFLQLLNMANCARREAHFI